MDQVDQDVDTVDKGRNPVVIHLNDSKAGMEGLDLERINKIINDSSRGSKFYEHKKKRQEQLKVRVALIQSQVQALSSDGIAKAEKQADGLAKEFEKKRDLSRIIVHLDMDAFYASVEMRDNPALKEIPMAVGGMSMLSTSNYHARKYGVRSGMPGFIAKKLCPQLTIVPLNFAKYIAASKEVEQVLSEYDKESLSVSMDEAVLDIGNYLAERNSMLPEGKEITPGELVAEIRAAIFAKTELTASGGIAANGLLAKICSDINKPNNQYFLESSKEAIESFLEELPIRKVGGIGPVTEETLKGIGIEKCRQLWDKRGIVQLVFKPATASFLLSVSMGIGNSIFYSPGEASAEDVRKSISCERTFGKADRTELRIMCQDLANELEKDLEKKKATSKTITLKIKTINFEVKTRARSLAEYTSSGRLIFDTAWAIYCSYEREISDLQLRLMGVRVSNLRFSDEEGDDDNGVVMKQQTLSQLFSKSNQEMLMERRTHRCPCCELEFTSFRELEPHVDECLLLGGTEVGKSSDNMGMENHMTMLKNYTDENVAELANLTDDGNEEQRQTAGLTAPCPICDRNFNFSCVDEVNMKMNEHIDECLNSPMLKQIMQGEKENERNGGVGVGVNVAHNSTSVFSLSTKRQLESDEVSSNSNPSPLKRSCSNKQKMGNHKSNPKSNNQTAKFLPIDSYFKRE